MNPPPFVTHCIELLAVAGRPRSRRMFGGYGLYLDDLFVAIVIRERLYLKVDDHSRAAFEAAGCEPFTWLDKTGQAHTMSYWTAPDQAMESPSDMGPWLKRAIGAALAARSATKRR